MGMSQTPGPVKISTHWCMAPRKGCSQPIHFLSGMTSDVLFPSIMDSLEIIFDWALSSIFENCDATLREATLSYASYSEITTYKHSFDEECNKAEEE